MFKYILSSLVILVASFNVFAVPPKITIPEQVKPVDGYVAVSPGDDCYAIVYLSLDGLDPFPAAFLKDSKMLLIPTKGEKPGTYKFIAVASSKDGDLARLNFSVVIDGPPTPPDPFVQAIKDAFAKETGSDKLKQIATLASLYKAASTTTVNDPSVKTLADLFTDMKTASASLLPPDALPFVRKAIGERLNKTLGTTSTPLDRTLAANEFKAVAEVLGGLK